jgi:hypothetical protein
MVTETCGRVKYRPAMEPIAGVYDGLQRIIRTGRPFRQREVLSG